MTPTMLTRSVVCPSGLSGEVRKLTVKEIPLFSDPQLAQSGEIFVRLLRTCWVSTTNGGPYEDDPFDWRKALIGDAIYTLIEIVRATNGDTFAFDVQCPACSKRISWELNLGDLRTTPITAEGTSALLNGKIVVVEARTSDGHEAAYRAHCRLATLGDELSGLKRKSQNPTLASLLQRIEGIEGIAAEELSGFLESLGPNEARDLVAEIDKKIGCGVDTDIDVVCQACGYDVAVALPFGQLLRFKRAKH